MIIAVPADASDLDAQVEHKLGTAPYLLVIDTADMSFEAVKSPDPSHGPGAGIQSVSLVLGMGVKTILTGYISPDIARTLRNNGIEIITSVSGIVRDVVRQYKRGEFSHVGDAGQSSIRNNSPASERHWREAFMRAARQFSGMLPVLIGVILLLGLFRVFLPKDFLLTLFSGNMFQDTFLGACAGSLMAGNPINSYVVGETLLDIGLSPFGVTAMMLTWVSVGLIQMPAEISELGAKFTVARNGAAFIIAIPASIFIVWLSGGIR